MLVSVSVLVYNHENFLAECLNGILAQHRNFELEIIVCDDFSSDNSSKIINKFIEDNPHIIKYYRHNKNIGLKNNSIFSLSKCNGDYIAFCDGDDFWIDNDKLQKQLIFLEKYLQYTFVCTNYISSKNYELKNEVNKEINFLDILKSNSIGTLTVFIRSAVIKNINLNEINESVFDFNLWLEVLLKGKGCKLSFYSAFYRIHDNSFSNSNIIDKKIKFNNEVLNIIIKYINQYSIVSNLSDEIIRDKFRNNFKYLRQKSLSEFISGNLKLFRLVKYITLLDLKIFIKGIFSFNFR